MKKIKIYILLLILFVNGSVFATEADSTTHIQVATEEFNIKEMILDHLADSYEWHIITINDKHISLSLPVILYSKTSGFHIFSSSKFHHGHKSYQGFSIAHEGEYKGKIVETDSAGNEVRPIDISITKNSFALIISSLLLIWLIMSVAKSYKRNPLESKKGFIGAMEMLIISINDDVIKPSIGKGYERYAPYLLTVFFFIFINNLLGLIPIFPGGANVTGNIAITMVLAIFTMLIVNFSGTKEYWKEIFWPDVPWWLKIPIPVMPLIELIGVFTKPFALMIRLFANILAGHSIVLGLVGLIFVTVELGTAINTSMTAVSILFTVFINFVELLVAFIQAYVFILLSAVFIGLAKIEPHNHHIEKKISEN